MDYYLKSRGGAILCKDGTLRHPKYAECEKSRIKTWKTRGGAERHRDRLPNDGVGLEIVSRESGQTTA